MGVGPSLHGLMPVFGVWPLRILDDQSSLRYLPPPFMLTARSRSRWNPSAERCSRFSIAATMTAKVSNSRRFSLRMGWARKNGMTFVQKIVAVPHHVDERLVPTTGSGVGPDPAAAESGPQELEDRSSLGVLADVELGDELPAEPCGRVPLDRDVEASFPVDVSRTIVVQPFLLIVRTRHVVTMVNVQSDVTK